MEQRIINKNGGLSPSRILDYFVTSTFFQYAHERHPYTFIILGKRGPTGKSWLTEALKKKGFSAIELSEHIQPMVEYRDNENHVIESYLDSTIIIVLNQAIRKGENDA